MNQKLLERVKVTVWICFRMSTDIRGKLASQNLGNSIMWTTKKLLIRILYESKVAWMDQSDSLDLFLGVQRHQGQAGQPELGEQHHLDPQETVYQETLWIKSCLNWSKWQSGSVSDVHRHQGDAGQPEPREQYHLDSPETVYEDTLLFKSDFPTDIKDKLASQNLGNSIIWSLDPQKLFISLLLYIMDQGSLVQNSREGPEGPRTASKITLPICVYVFEFCHVIQK